MNPYQCACTPSRVLTSALVCCVLDTAGKRCRNTVVSIKTYIRWDKRETPEKTRQPAASSGTIPTCKNLGLNLGLQTDLGMPTAESLLGRNMPVPFVIVADDKGHGGRQFSPTEANQGQFPAGLLPGFLISLALAFLCCSLLTSIIFVGSQDPAFNGLPNFFTHLLVNDSIGYHENVMKAYPGSQPKGRKKKIFNHMLSRSCRVSENTLGIRTLVLSVLGKLLLNPGKAPINGTPLWEDLVAKATKLHTCLRATIQAITSYLDAFQKIADAATNARVVIGCKQWMLVYSRSTCLPAVGEGKPPGCLAVRQTTLYSSLLAPCLTLNGIERVWLLKTVGRDRGHE
ncbi:hypothetical protein PR048_025789 [Dryococelus australis]|uniref:IMD domain-containing protein n=1 Tax=Dryococelus australis TaxID=614101 RepID=A0ABQ9GJK3_9NEOP|nr:hypothetical protein PR048_025789 [Dryococelus australis]